MNEAEKKSKSNKKIVLVILGILILLISGLLVFIFMSNDDSGSSKNKNSNNNNKKVKPEPEPREKLLSLYFIDQERYNQGLSCDTLNIIVDKSYDEPAKYYAKYECDSENCYAFSGNADKYEIERNYIVINDDNKIKLFDVKNNQFIDIDIDLTDFSNTIQYYYPIFDNSKPLYISFRTSDLKTYALYDVSKNKVIKIGNTSEDIVSVDFIDHGKLALIHAPENTKAELYDVSSGELKYIYESNAKTNQGDSVGMFDFTPVMYNDTLLIAGYYDNNVSGPDLCESIFKLSGEKLISCDGTIDLGNYYDEVEYISKLNINSKYLQQLAGKLK